MCLSNCRLAQFVSAMLEIERHVLNKIKPMSDFVSPGAKLYLDLIFVASHCEKVVIVPDMNCMKSSVRKLMLDTPGPGSFQV